MMTILLFKKELKWIGWENLKHQLVPSILMIVIANGFTTVAEQTVPSGLASVISAMSPILIFLGSILFKLQKPSLKGFIGVIIGFSGVVFIFKDGLGSFLDADYRIGMMFMGFAITAWAGGTIYTKLHGNKSKNIVLNLFYQFTMGSCIQIVLAFIFSPTIDLNLWSSKSILAALYLSIFGSVIAFFSYNYALKHVTPVQVSILAYINTVIAVFFGWLILDEKITIDFIIATILIILGVFIINYKKKEKKTI